MGLTKQERHALRYGPPGYREHVLSKGCVVDSDGPGCVFHGKPFVGVLEFEHYRTWGSGHGYRYGVCMCRGHHAEKGRGVKTFQKKYGLNLGRIAERNYQEWLADQEF